MRLDVPGLVQVQNVYRPEEWTVCGEGDSTDTAQDLLTRRRPHHALRFSVPVNSLRVVNVRQLKQWENVSDVGVLAVTYVVPVVKLVALLSQARLQLA